jgi:hyperosmotically inducible protein
MTHSAAAPRRSAAPAWLATLLAALVPLSAVAGKSPGQMLDDSTLATRTKAALLDVDKAAGASLNVEVRRGQVQLGGFVESEASKREALRVAAELAGAGNVLDAVVVLHAGRSVGRTLDDTTLQARLKAALAADSPGSAVSINTEVRRGEVLLSGFVPTDAARERAGTIARGITGVATVHNRLAVLP